MLGTFGQAVHATVQPRRHKGLLRTSTGSSVFVNYLSLSTTATTGRDQQQRRHVSFAWRTRAPNETPLTRKPPNGGAFG